MYTVLVPVDDAERRVRTQIEAVLDLPNAPADVSVELFRVRTELEFADSDEEVWIGETRTDLGDDDIASSTPTGR